MEQLEICIVCLDFIPYRNSGVAIYTEKLVKGLVKKHNITIITLQQKGTQQEECIDNIKVIRIPPSKFDKTKWISFGYKASKLLIKLGRNNEFDIVHFVDIHLGYAYSKPFVATLHQSFNQRLKGAGIIPYHSSLINLFERYVYYNIAKLLEKKALKKTIKLVSVSNATKEEFVMNYNINPKKIKVIYNGIDTNSFHFFNSDKLKKDLKIKDNQKVLLYVGFTTPRKGVEYLAKAANMIKHDCKIIMIGKWESGYKKKFYQHLGDNFNKIIELGYIDDKDMPYYYSLADVFIFPSLLEGFGYPLVEALSCETPVIATQVGSIPEIVYDCGVIVPPRNSKQLANAINILLADGDLKQKIGKNGRIRVEKFFSEKTMSEKYLNFYSNINNY